MDSLLVHSNLTSDSSVSGRAAGVIFDFSLEYVELSYQFSIELRRANFNEINIKIVNKVVVYIADALLCPVNVIRIPVTTKLIIHYFCDENLE